MKGNSHVRFGERGGETRWLKSQKVRSAPTLRSGNFLYVSLQLLLDLQHEVINFSDELGLGRFFVSVSPRQLNGIETNEYAHELAQITIWIGYIQWMMSHGYGHQEPVLQTMDNIHHMDAILAFDAGGKPVEPEWPAADVILGNPPFLGGNKVRAELGSSYVDTIFKLYDGRVPALADLVCYWFEKARAMVESGRVSRAGLLATQGIRAGANRKVLERIKESGDIFWAQSNKEWVLDGAAVRVSMVCFDNGVEQIRELDGISVNTIHADLTFTADITQAVVLSENTGLAFVGSQKIGAFDIPAEIASKMLTAQGNPNGRPNSDVVKPSVNGSDLMGTNRNVWIIDFGVMPIGQAAMYEMPFEYIKEHVYPERQKNNRESYARKWWQHGEARPGMRRALENLSRFIVTSRVSRHRVFVWLTTPALPDHKLCVIARSDDYFIGVLQSKPHEIWSLKTGARHGVGNDPVYNVGDSFETFPFPWQPGCEPANDPRVQAIAQAAKELVDMRYRWLNAEGLPEAESKKRTLTNLYNARPTWLDLAHKKLDSAVFAAYGWPENLSDEQILEKLLALNLERASGQ